jgi:hypothetical protein
MLAPVETCLSLINPDLDRIVFLIRDLEKVIIVIVGSLFIPSSNRDNNCGSQAFPLGLSPYSAGLDESSFVEKISADFFAHVISSIFKEYHE